MVRRSYYTNLPKKLGYEIKRADAPVLTSSMRTAFKALELDQLTIIYPGTKSYRLGLQIIVKPFEEVLEE